MWYYNLVLLQDGKFYVLDKSNIDEKQYIIGRGAVTEAIKAGRPIDYIMTAKGTNPGTIAALAAKNGITVKEVSRVKLDGICPQGNHQGVIAMAAAADYVSVEDILDAAEQKGEPPFIIISDGLEDPHNLGAVIRTADAVGAHGVIIPKRRAVGLTYGVGKASAGAVEYVPVAKVTNLNACIDDLKKRGLWIYGMDMDGQCWCEADLNGPAAFIVGNEGKGMSRLIREQCDFVLSLPMYGKINSLNASVAAGVILYEAARQRNAIKAKN
ncbi:MAG: 23S rRNA (guanosine(2251)-2'-O)-methyltransferase RlmB [Clostridia bacterium]|nr:23S rRNA (guanosine(2251)-2'-O)-methyltransferase RlmB [Clostridia bacterium]